MSSRATSDALPRWLRAWAAPGLLALGVVAWVELSDVVGVLGDRAGATPFAWARLVATYTVAIALVLWFWERIWPVLRTGRFAAAFVVLGAIAWLRDPLLSTPLEWLGLRHGDIVVTATEMRSLRIPLERQATPADLAERLGFEMEPAGGMPARAFHFVLPEGWQEQPPNEIRWINLRAEDAECYVTLLPGGGDLLANINRWRGQIGLPELAAEALGSLPRHPLLGSEAVLVEGQGSFQGAADQGLLGLIAQNTGGTLTVKMVGPRATVERQRAAFLGFAKSLAPSPEIRAMADGRKQIAADPEATSAGWSWQVPEGWRRGPERAMREVTFLIGDEPAAECWVSVLNGDGGGLLANLNRWRGELGLPGIGRVEEQKLETVRALGGQAMLVELAGSYQGRSGPRIDEASMLGVAASLPDRTVFVKLVGRRALVAAERDRFVSFVQSLTEKR